MTFCGKVSIELNTTQVLPAWALRKGLEKRKPPFLLSSPASASESCGPHASRLENVQPTSHAGPLCPVQVLSWILFTGIFSYVKVVIGSLLHEAGHAALLWCGISIQAGSLLGALAMFPLVNVYQAFARAQDCADNCL